MLAENKEVQKWREDGGTEDVLLFQEVTRAGGAFRCARARMKVFREREMGDERQLWQKPGQLKLFM